MASPVATPNLSLKKRFADLPLRKLGVLSALGVPLHLNKRPFGVLGVYRRSHRAFTTADVEFAEMIAHLLTSSIARARAEEALQQQSAFTTAVLATVGAVVIVLDPQGNLVSVNRACEQVTGFTADQVRGKPFCNVFAPPEELDHVRMALHRAVHGADGQEFQSSLLTKDGLHRSIAWSLQPLRSRNNTVQSIVLTGLDRTEQVETLAQLQQAKAAAKESARMLSELRESLYAGNHAVAGSATAELVSPGHGTQSTAAPRQHQTLQPFHPVNAPTGSERRKSPRRSYRYRQRASRRCLAACCRPPRSLWR